MNLKRLLRERLQHASPDGGEPGGTPPVSDGGVKVDPSLQPSGTPAPDSSSDPAPADPSDWRAALPPELRENPTLKDVKSIEGLAKRLVDTKALVGQSLRVPGPDASPEDHAAFRQSLLEKNIGLMPVPNGEDAEAEALAYKALGLPDEPSQYPRPENWTGMTDERFGFIVAEAHKANMTKKQFETMANALAQADNAIAEQYETEHASGISQLKGEWGNAYEQKVSRAVLTAKQLEAPAALQEALSAGNVDAGTLRWLDSIANKFGKEGTSLVSEEGQVSEFTPSEARERMEEISRKMIGMDTSDPAYQDLLKKRIKYAEMLHPG